MKTITRIFILAAFTIFMACEGPAGLPGQDGLDGDSLIGSVFEIEGDFTAANDYSLYFSFPTTIKVFDSDVVLVYILWEQVQSNSGGALDVWRLLPQTIILSEGILQYNYDFTKADVQVFLEGSIDFRTLLPSEALDQVFRIVVLPASFANSKSVDILDLNSLMKSMGTNPFKIEKIELQPNNF
jgi:hypothetical protein